MTEFADAESFKSGATPHVSYREIVLLHYRKITQLACVEFRGGYTTQKTRASGMASWVESIYIPDTRETYVNAIDMLHDLLLPHFDKKMKEESEKIEQELIDKKEELKQAKETKKDEKIEKFSDAKLKIKRRLFQQLSLLLNRLRYLEGKSFSEIA